MTEPRERLTLKTYSHLAGDRRMPSEYELLTSKLNYAAARGLEVEAPLSAWYRRYQSGSRLTATDWERFCDPRETTYASYTALQEKKEAFLDGLFAYQESTAYDSRLPASWVARLAKFVAPLCYPFHGLQMVAAYVGTMAPSGRVTVAAAFQAADELRRVQRLAYRVRALSVHHSGFGLTSKATWQDDPAWQPLREAIERLLVTYDWGEALVGLNLCVKPWLDELFMIRLAAQAEREGDQLLRELFFSFAEDCAWQREWTAALVSAALADTPANHAVINEWVATWSARARAAVRALLPALGEEKERIGSELDEWYTQHLASAGVGAPR